MTQERASIESCRAAIGTHDEDGMVEIEASILEDALDYLESELAAREKRMREVADVCYQNELLHSEQSPEEAARWRSVKAKLLEGLGESASKRRRDVSEEEPIGITEHGDRVYPWPYAKPRVEGSHAKLRDELMRLGEQAISWTTGTYEEQHDNAHHVRAECRKIAARVEALGRVEEKKAALIEIAKGKAAQMESYIQQTGNPVTGQDGLLLAAVRALVESEKKSDT